MCSGVHCPQCFTVCLSVLHCRRFKSSLRTPTSRYNTAFLPVLGTWCSTITNVTITTITSSQSGTGRCGAVPGSTVWCLFYCFSIAIVWSEVTFSININDVRLSVFAQLIYLGHQRGNYIAIEVSVYILLLVDRLVCRF